jgi:hypothetical protein
MNQYKRIKSSHANKKKSETDTTERDANVHTHTNTHTNTHTHTLLAGLSAEGVSDCLHHLHLKHVSSK